MQQMTEMDECEANRLRLQIRGGLYPARCATPEEALGATFMRITEAAVVAATPTGRPRYRGSSCRLCHFQRYVTSDNEASRGSAASVVVCVTGLPRP
jgi:hypothetical protein